MHFFTMTRIYRDPGDAISLRDVWTIVGIRDFVDTPFERFRPMRCAGRATTDRDS